MNIYFSATPHNQPHANDLLLDDQIIRRIFNQGM
jgi:hypothetical protein